tara:strand:- start:23584 stop:25026 length:1443 start_codon:yes stop_codon:yes gene_type:complete
MENIGIEKLPYSYSALERFIDSETMDIHYNKHYKGYVKKLNNALVKKVNNGVDLEQIIKGVSRYSETVRNNAGGAFNHSLFWKMLSPKTQRAQGEIYKKIISDFGDFSKFKRIFSNESLKNFGSGWTWLVLTNTGKLKVMSTTNQDNPLMDVIKNGGYPLLGIDTWEHAYYLKYRNKRDEYVKNFWSVVNWDFVNELYGLRTKKKLDEVTQVKTIIFEGASAGCNRNQVQGYRRLFNTNPEIKRRFMHTIMDILKEVFSEYWYEKNKYDIGQMSGVYDYEQKGRSVINKLNTNYTAFCTLVNDTNQYLKKYGVDAINFNNKNRKEEQTEVDRFNKYLVELRYKIFDSESPTFKTVMSGLDKTNRFGDKREVDAVVKLKELFKTDKVKKVGELGGVDDMIKGIDATVDLGEGIKTIQIKPFNRVSNKNGKVIVYGTANVKPYKTDYLVFHNNKLGTKIFDNSSTKIINGRYVFNESSEYIN